MSEKAPQNKVEQSETAFSEQLRVVANHWWGQDLDTPGEEEEKEDLIVALEEMHVQRSVIEHLDIKALANLVDLIQRFRSGTPPSKGMFSSSDAFAIGDLFEKVLSDNRIYSLTYRNEQEKETLKIEVHPDEQNKYVWVLFSYTGLGLKEPVFFEYAAYPESPTEKIEEAEQTKEELVNRLNAYGIVDAEIRRLTPFQLERLIQLYTSFLSEYQERGSYRGYFYGKELDTEQGRERYRNNNERGNYSWYLSAQKKTNHFGTEVVHFYYQDENPVSQVKNISFDVNFSDTSGYYESSETAQSIEKSVAVESNSEPLFQPETHSETDDQIVTTELQKEENTPEFIVQPEPETILEEEIAEDKGLHQEKVSLESDEGEEDITELVSVEESLVIEPVDAEPTMHPSDILYEKVPHATWNNTGYSFYRRDGKPLSSGEVYTFIRKQKKEGNPEFLEAFKPHIKGKDAEGTSPTFEIRNSKYRYYAYSFDPDWGKKEEEEPEITKTDEKYIGKKVYETAFVRVRTSEREKFAGIRLHDFPSPEGKNTKGKGAKVYTGGTGLTILAYGNDDASGWILVQTPDGQTGWIAESWTKKAKVGDDTRYTLRYVEKGETITDLLREIEDVDRDIGYDNKLFANALWLLNKDNPDVYINQNKYKQSLINNAAKNAVDPWDAEKRAILQSIEVKQGAQVKVPTKQTIDQMIARGTIEVRPDWVTAGIKTARIIEGLLEGIPIGIYEQAKDTVTGIWDMIKSIFTGEILDQLVDLYNALWEMSWEDVKKLLLGLLGIDPDEFERIWNSKNITTVERYKFIGEIIGRLIFEILIIVFTGGAALARYSSKIPALAKLSRSLQKAKKIIPDNVADKLRKTEKATDKVDEAVVLPVRRKFDPKTATAKQKGNFGEIVSDKHLRNKHNLKRIGDDPPKTIDDKLRKGIDGIYENNTPPPKYVINESKYGQSQLNQTKDGKQMSDDWIRGSDRLEDQVGLHEAKKIREALKKGEVDRVLSRIDETGKVTTKKLDSKGNIIGDWP